MTDYPNSGQYPKELVEALVRRISTPALKLMIVQMMKDMKMRIVEKVATEAKMVPRKASPISAADGESSEEMRRRMTSAEMLKTSAEMRRYVDVATMNFLLSMEMVEDEDAVDDHILDHPF